MAAVADDLAVDAAIWNVIRLREAVSPNDSAVVDVAAAVRSACRSLSVNTRPDTRSAVAAVDEAVADMATSLKRRSLKVVAVVYEVEVVVAVAEVLLVVAEVAADEVAAVAVAAVEVAVVVVVAEVAASPYRRRIWTRSWTAISSATRR